MEKNIMAVKLQLSSEMEDILPGVEALEQYMDACDLVLPAEEGFLADLFWSGPIVAIIHRNDGTVKHLKPLIKECFARIKAAPDDKFGSKSGMTEFGDKGGFGVYAIYLPDQNQVAGAGAALKKATQYLVGCKDPSKFSYDKFKACFNGSCYVKKGKFSKDTLKGTGFWNLYSFPIQSRGWTKKQHFLDGLKIADELVKCMEQLEVHCTKLQHAEVKDEYKEVAKEMIKAIRATSDLCAHFGRGMTVASKGVLRGTAGRIIQKIFGEK